MTISAPVPIQLKKLAELLRRYGQVNFDSLTSSFRKTSQFPYSPDLVFLNSSTSKAVIIEYKDNSSGSTLPVGLISTMFNYRNIIEHTNAETRFVIVSKNDFAKSTMEMLDKINIVHISLHSLSVEECCDEIVELTKPHANG